VADDSLERHVGTPTLAADLGPLRGSCRSMFPPKGLSTVPAFSRTTAFDFFHAVRATRLQRMPQL
jgi:hypothetical protein